jgi:hypothetical protein
MRTRFGVGVVAFVAALTVIVAGQTGQQDKPQNKPHGKTLAKGQAKAQGNAQAKPKPKVLTEAGRRALIQKAQIWTATNIAQMDLRAGPQDPGAFQPDEAVTCDYVETKLPGTSRKFDCALSEEDVVKVRYGEEGARVWRRSGLSRSRDVSRMFGRSLEQACAGVRRTGLRSGRD